MRELVVEALSRFALHERVYEFRETWLFWQARSTERDVRRRSEAPGAVLHRKVLSRANFSIGSGVGGARRDRTDDLLLAKQALSQLSYGPGRKRSIGCYRLIMVGLGRLELPTSRLSGVRSNHLSYRPDAKRTFSDENASSCLKKEKRRRRNPALF